MQEKISSSDANCFKATRSTCSKFRAQLMTSQYEQCVKATEDPKFKVILTKTSFLHFLCIDAPFFRNFASTVARTRRLGRKKEGEEVARTRLGTGQEEEEEEE